MAANLRQFDLPLGRQPLEVRRLRREWEGHAVSPISGAVRGFTADGQAAVTAVGTVLQDSLNAYRMASVAAGTNLLRAPIPNSSIGVGANQGAAFLIQFRTVTATTGVFLGGLGSDSGSSGNTIFSILTGTGAASRLRVTVGNAVTNTAAEITGSVINDGQIHTALLSLNEFNTTGSCTYSVFLDGQLLVEQTDAVQTGASFVYNWVTAGSVRRTTDLAIGATCQIALAVPFRRRVSREQGIALTRDPWGTLFQQRRIVMPVAAAGAGNTIAVPAGSLTLTGFAPTVTATANQVVSVPAGTLTLTVQTPTVTSGANQTISVPAGTLTLTANAPTVAVSANQSISIPAGALTLAGQAPTVTASANKSVAVPLGSLTLSGLAPNVLNGAQQVVQVPLGTLTLTGQTPTVAVSANQVIAVPAGTLTLTGQTPTVVATNPQLISVPLGTLTLTGLVPNVSNVGVNNQISVPRGTLTMSGGTPVVRVSTDADVFLDRFAARSRITQSLRFGSRITTQVGLRSSLKD